MEVDKELHTFSQPSQIFHALRSLKECRTLQGNPDLTVLSSVETHDILLQRVGLKLSKMSILQFLEIEDIIHKVSYL